MPVIRILSVGQCSYDDGRIRRSILKGLDAEVIAVSTQKEAQRILREEKFDVVLVNRIGDQDSALGLDFIQLLKSEPTTANIRSLLVSDLADAQEAAVRLGAAKGFGKVDLETTKPVEALVNALAISPSVNV